MRDKRDKGVEVLASLTEDEWVDLYNQLHRYIARRYHGPLCNDDLISKAFECVREHRRQHWDVNKSPYINLREIVTSLASNDLVRLKKEVPLEALKNFVRGSTTSQSPAKAFEDREMDQIFISRMKKAVEGDPLLERILPYFFTDPPCKPAEIAAAVHVDPSEIYKARKRLQRRVAMSQE